MNYTLPNGVELNVLVNGHPVRTYHHEGKTLIESREGTTYSLSVKNNTSRRIKAIISVDGLSILNGKAAKDGPDEIGYIIAPWTTEIFKGYRVDENKVAEFTFVRKSKSYAKVHGNGRNVGVIALRIYGEKIKNIPNNILFTNAVDSNSSTESSYGYRTYYLAQAQSSETNSSNERAKCGAGNMALRAANAFDMGSSWGKGIKESVTYTTFETGDLINEIAVYYASKSGLESLGVKTTRDREVAYPEPFKRIFCPTPPDWHD